jgi:ribosome-associated translation inhibitor RaiA
MNAPLQIAFHNVEGSEDVKELIAEKADWLGRVYDRVTACRVVVEGPSPRRRPSCPYRVRIDLAVPGGSVVVSRALSSRAVDRGLGGVIRDAFDVARRRLDAYARRMRDEVKSHGRHPEPL